MKALNRILLAFILTLLLGGCVARSDMEKVVKSMQATNNAATKIINILEQRDKDLAQTLNKRQNTLKASSKNKIEKSFLESKLAILELKSKAIDDIEKLYQDTLKGKESNLNEEFKDLNNRVDEAEKQAESLHRESVKFPNDKELRLQAAQAAAGYFGKLTKANRIKENTEKKFKDALLKEKSKAELDLEKTIESKVAELEQEKSIYIAKIEKQNFPTVKQSSSSYQLLLDWTEENESAHRNTQFYLDTNNPLSNGGILASTFKGMKKGFTKTLLGQVKKIPTKNDLKASAKSLFGDIIEDSQSEFNKKKDKVKNDIERIKDNLKAGNLNIIMDLLKNLNKS